MAQIAIPLLLLGTAVLISNDKNENEENEEENSGKEITRVGERKLGKRAGTTVEITQKQDYYKISIITKQNNPWVNKKKNDSNTEEYIKYLAF